MVCGVCIAWRSRARGGTGSRRVAWSQRYREEPLVKTVVRGVGLCNAALLCVLAAGCAQPPRGYLGRRAMDFGDCFTLTAGYGLISYARVKFTDWVVVGTGMASRERWGWRGRYGDRGWEKKRGRGDVYIGDMHYEAGLPLVANEEGSDGKGNRVSTIGTSGTKRRYAKDLEPGGWVAKIADRCWIGIATTAGLSFEVGVNIAELIDFILGLTSLDICADDSWAPKPIEDESVFRDVDKK